MIPNKMFTMLSLYSVISTKKNKVHIMLLDISLAFRTHLNSDPMVVRDENIKVVTNYPDWDINVAHAFHL